MIMETDPPTYLKKIDIPKGPSDNHEKRTSNGNFGLLFWSRLNPEQFASLSEEERTQLAISALSTPSARRSLQQQRVIEDTIESFAYIQKMKKFNQNLAKQVTKAVSYQRNTKGSAIFLAGQHPEHFYLIISGRVAVLLQRPEADLAADRRNPNFVTQQQYPQTKLGTHQLGNSKDESLTQGLSRKISSGSTYSLYSSIKNNNLEDIFTFPKQSSNKDQILMKSLSQTQSSLQLQQNEIPSSRFSIQRRCTIQGIDRISGLNPLSLTERRRSISPIKICIPLALSPSKISEQQFSLFKEERTEIQRYDSIVESGRKPPLHNLLRKKVLCKGVNLTVDDLEDPELFYDKSGCFLYEFAKNLEKGSAFGEMGLLLKVPRTATILAVEDTDLAVMNKQSYSDIINNLEDQKMEKKKKFFQKALHAEFKNNDLIKICIAFSFKKKIIPGQFLFNEGDLAEDIHVVKSGDIELSKQIPFRIDSQQRRGNSVQFSVLGEGEMLGVEELLIEQNTRYYNAKCMNSVTVFSISWIQFDKLLNEIPDLKRIMKNRSVNRLQWQKTKIIEVAQNHQKYRQSISTLNDKLTLIQLKDLKLPSFESVSKDQINSNQNQYRYFIERDSEQIDNSAPLSPLKIHNKRERNRQISFLSELDPIITKIPELNSIEEYLKGKREILDIFDAKTNQQIKGQVKSGDEIIWIDSTKKKELEDKVAHAIRLKRSLNKPQIFTFSDKQLLKIPQKIQMKVQKYQLERRKSQVILNGSKDQEVKSPSYSKKQHKDVQTKDIKFKNGSFFQKCKTKSISDLYLISEATKFDLNQGSLSPQKSKQQGKKNESDQPIFIGGTKIKTAPDLPSSGHRVSSSSLSTYLSFGQPFLDDEEGSSQKSPLTVTSLKQYLTKNINTLPLKEQATISTQISPNFKEKKYQTNLIHSEQSSPTSPGYSPISPLQSPSLLHRKLLVKADNNSTLTNTGSQSSPRPNQNLLTISKRTRINMNLNENEFCSNAYQLDSIKKQSISKNYPMP